jgi:hypothetical protein
VDAFSWEVISSIAGVIAAVAAIIALFPHSRRHQEIPLPPDQAVTAVTPAYAIIDAPVMVGDIPREPPGFQPRTDLLAALDAPGPEGRVVVVHALTGLRGAARETVEIARAAREADERYTQLAHLREIGRSVQRILLSALQAMDSDLSASAESMTPYLAKARWRSAEQNMLGVLLVGVEPPLPKCKALVGESQAGQVVAAARVADAELAAVFHNLCANY